LEITSTAKPAVESLQGLSFDGATGAGKDAGATKRRRGRFGERGLDIKWIAGKRE